MHRSAEEVAHQHDSHGPEDDELNVPAITYANSGSSTSRMNYSGRDGHGIGVPNRIAVDPHHSEESSADGYDNVPLILGNNQQGE